ncbi:RLA1-like protein [Mya arenaria]|uniref:RLA1-like protein n=1 Tax=Mya arenaria TaxID=6604 RepID=A0ABY7F2J8_MYAAR|nr:RLA1-like protein [Mya arenaria]
MASTDELACTYAALILADDQVTVTDDKIKTILKAAGVNVEPYWPEEKKEEKKEESEESDDDMGFGLFD